jgi:multidrug efflux pump subunit AcrB
MNFSAWSIRNPVPAVLLFVLLTLLGSAAFRAMKVQTFPDIDLPTVVVSAALPGAAAAQLETDVAAKLENALATLQQLKHLRTKVQDGAVTIAAEFRLEKPSQEALDEVRSAVARARADLPAELREPLVTKLNLAGSPIVTYTLASPTMDAQALSWFVDNTVVRRLRGLRGVGAVQRVGGVTREVRVELDPARLLAMGASAADLSRQLRQVQQDAGAGRASLHGGEQPLRTVGTLASAADLAATEISLPGPGEGRRVRLDQVATVRDTVAETRSTALFDGRPVVGFEVMRALRSGEIEVAAAVRAELAALQAEHPDLVLSEAFNLVDAVQDNYDASLQLLLEGALLAVLVVWFFLRDWRATVVAATALPLSLIPAFAVMHHVFGLTLNLLTMLSLSLVVGILVDDAIVEVENIMRHLQMGKSPRQAAMEAADEIGLAVIATTFALIAVFLPTAFLAGVPGKFFLHFGWTAAIAVFFSLVVARLLTPMMCAYLLQRSDRSQAAAVEPRWLRHVTRWARWCLQHRGWTLGAALALFVATLGLVPLLPTGFIPPDDTSQTQVRISLQPGSSFASTLALAEDARAIVRRHPQVLHTYTAVGGGATGGDPFAAAGAAEVRTATLTLTLTPRAKRSGVSKQQIESELRQALLALPGARVQVGFGANSETYTLLLGGDDPQALGVQAKLVENAIRGIPSIGNVSSSASLLREELVVRPDAVRAADLGVSTAAIAETLRVATAGDFEPALAKMNFSQRQVPIVVRLPGDARADLALLSRLPVPGTRGPVPLSNVATLALESGPSEIERLDRRRTIAIAVELNQMPLGAVQQAVLALPAVRGLPAGIHAAPAGDAEAMHELFDSFGLALLTGVLCIYAVLVLLFKDFVQPLTILGALVLSVPGALLALAATGTAISMPSLIGLVMLMGITAKNSILLVDYAIHAHRDLGLGRREAALDAVRKRARPIVMTTVAMAAGMLPVALGLGADPSFRAPMAVVAVGGLITSTVLSLLVIPALFVAVDDLAQAVRRRLRPASRGRRLGRRQDQAADGFAPTVLLEDLARRSARRG